MLTNGWNPGEVELLGEQDGTAKGATAVNQVHPEAGCLEELGAACFHGSQFSTNYRWYGHEVTRPPEPQFPHLQSDDSIDFQ